GQPVQFSIMVFTVQYIQQDADVLVSQLSKLKNVQVSEEQLASTDLVRRYNAGTYQAYLTTQHRWNEPAIDMVLQFLSTSTGDTVRYSNPTVDAALNQLVTATDPKTRKQLYKTAMTQILKDSPVIWYTRQASNSILAKRVGAYPVYFDQVPL